MMESKSMIGKIIWCLLFLTCTVLSGRQIFLLILQYTSNLVNTHIAIEYDSVYFPEVTFCNLNPLSYGKLNSTHKGRHFLKRLYTGDIYDKHLSTLWQTMNDTEEFPEGCVLASVDLVFILDSSDSVGYDNWNKMLKFCIDMLTKSDIDSGSVRVSLVTYHSTVSIQFYLNDFTNKEEILHAIRSIEYTFGGTYTHKALEITRTKIFSVENGDRVDVKNIAILLTDGISLYPLKTREEAKTLRNSGVIVYVVGVERAPSEYFQTEIEYIASSPVDEHIFKVNDFGILNSISRKLFSSLCPDFNALLNLQMEFRQNLMLYAYNMSLENTSAETNEFVLACSFNRKTCKTGSITSVYDDFYGKCYRFPTEPLLVTDEGQIHGLQIIFNVNQSDYLPYVSDEAGVRLLVNPYGVPLSLERNGISVATGLRTGIALRQKSTRLLPDKSGCDYTGQFKSKDACVQQCIQSQSETKCNCSMPRKFTTLSNYTLCFPVEGKRCLLELQHVCRRYTCKNPCRETFYEPVLTMSTWPAEQFIHSSKLTRAFGEDREEFSKYKNNLLMVNIFFDDLSVEVTEEEYSITIENLLSNIGGSLGLWIGMSVITIVEFLELFTIVIKTVLRIHSSDENEETKSRMEMNESFNCN